MKRFALVGLGVALAALCITGCSWETGSDAESWSSSYNWVNFSGTYRGASGGFLVTDYSSTPVVADDSSTDPVEKPVSDEYQRSFNTGDTKFGDNLAHKDIVAGSVNITLVGLDWSGTYGDDGNGVLGNSEGTIRYGPGSWTLDLGILAPAPSAGKIYASYVYKVTPGPGGGGDSGASGISIYNFNVTHSGQHLTIVDNNGSTYTGRITDMSSASGAQNTDIGQVAADETANDSSLHSKNTYYESPLPENGDVIIAPFECTGISAAGMAVKIVGTLEGTVAAGVFTGRKMNGTWVEVGGKTGNIYGTTTAITVPSTEAEAEPAADAAG